MGNNRRDPLTGKTFKMLEVEQGFGRPIDVLLIDLHHKKNLKLRQIGEELGVSFHAVWDWLHELNIPVRSFSESMKGNNWNCGKRYSLERRKKLSEAKKGVYDGEKNPNWRGGKSFEPYGLEFNEELKERIRKRDGYVCQECGVSQKELDYKLHVHHIDYDKKNNDPSNLISLCRGCNSKANFKREKWIKHFKVD